MFRNRELAEPRKLRSFFPEADAKADPDARVHAANSRSPYESLPCARACVAVPAVILSSRSISDGTRSGSFVVVVDRTTRPIAAAICTRRAAYA
jgi:hypothetical protein